MKDFGFIPIDDKGLARVSLAQKICFVISIITLNQNSLFPTEFSVLGTANVMKGGFFKLDDYLGRKVTTTEKVVFNLLLYVPFFVQHLVMARMWFKEAMQRRWRNYVFYERLLFNLVSSILCFFMFQLYQADDRVLFEIDFPYARVIWYVFYALGLGLLGWSVIDMGENDLFCFGLLRDWKKNKGSKFPAFVDVETQSILRASCRHPLYASLFVINTFGPTAYTATRFGHIITMEIFTYIGAVMEQKGLKKLPGYTDYMKATPNQFIPDIRAWFRRPKEAKKD